MSGTFASQPVIQESLHALDHDQDKHNETLSPLAKDFIAGGIAGAMAISITQPLDTVRVRIQNAALSQHTTPGVQSTHSRPQGVLSMLRQMVGREGITSPWKGLALPLAFASVQSAILFQIYGESLRRQTEGVASSQGQGQQVHSTHSISADGRVIPTAWNGFVAGCAAGFGQVWLWSPIELLKLRLQLQSVSRGSPGYLGPAQMTARIHKEEGGIRGLYRGLSVTLIRDVPSFGVYFGLYHAFVPMMEPGIHPEDAKAMTHVLAGGTAGCLSWCSVYGLDVIKTRMQATTAQQHPGKTWMHFAKEVWQQEGIKGLTRGIQPTLARAFVMDAVAFLGYNISLKALSQI